MMWKKKIIFTGLVLLGGVVLLVSCTILKPSAPPKDEKRIVLTFDDGPSTVTSEKLLDVLKKHDVKVMFCYVGDQAVKHPEIVKRAINEGHSLGIHTMSHDLKSLSHYDTLIQEIHEYKEFVKNLMTERKVKMDYFRPPFGVVTHSVKKAVEAENLKYAYVTSYVHDAITNEKNHEEMIAKLKGKIQKNQGGAIVLHEMRYGQGDGYEVDKSWLPETVENFIIWAKAEGYEFTQYDEL